MRKTVKFSRNPFAVDEVEVSDEEDEAEKAKKEHKAQMEEGGFIMVEEEGTSKKGRGTDGVNTVQGINPEIAKEYFEK
jgi:hypothetical protein